MGILIVKKRSSRCQIALIQAKALRGKGRWTHSPTDDLIGLMRKSLGLNSAVTAAFLILCSASASNAEPDTAIDHAPAPVEAAQGPNMTVVPDLDANVSTAQTVHDAAKIMPSVFQSR